MVGVATTVGYALSPGGLLLPYHVGALAALEYNGRLSNANPLAGASAGAIACASHGCGLEAVKALEATIRVSDSCAEVGGARGNLLPFLRREMEILLPGDAHNRLNERPSPVGLAYRQIFPSQERILQTQFESKQDVMDAVCHSSAFPFFTSNWPFAVARTKKNTEKEGDSSATGLTLPRLVVDGFFNVPRDRCGCPDFSILDKDPILTSSSTSSVENGYEKLPLVGRTVTIAVFPHEVVGLTASELEDRISPDGGMEEMANLLRLATQVSSREELTAVYEAGWADAERWCRQEEGRQREEFQKDLIQSRFLLN
eukprot:scaffold41696_cov53-Attheya_sp.AAC.4